MDRYYPMMLSIKDKKCKVIGGGRVAERKVKDLLHYGALVTVISPSITPRLLQYYRDGRISFIKRKYIYGDLKGSYLVYAASDDEKVNGDCFKESREKGILVNVADEPQMCDFIVPAKISRGHLNISVSTDGKSPMLSRKIKEKLETIFSEEYEEYLDILGEIRERAKTEIDNIHRRRKIFNSLVYSSVFDRYLKGEINNLKEELYNIYFNLYKTHL